MEGQNIQNLITLGTIFIVFFSILFLVILIDKRRKLYSKQTMINLLENQCLNEINSLRDQMEKEIEDLQKQIETLKRGQ